MKRGRRTDARMHRSNGAKRPFRVRNSAEREREEESENFVKIPPSFASSKGVFLRLTDGRRGNGSISDCLPLSFAVMIYLAEETALSKLSFPHCGGCNTFRRRRRRLWVPKKPTPFCSSVTVLGRQNGGFRQNRPCVLKFLI